MTTKDIVYIALFAALMAALGVVPPVPASAFGVPITAQSLGPMLAGGILGAKRGGLSMLLFVVLVAVGLPLLSGGRGGLAVFAGASGGFVIGFIAASFVVGIIVERFWQNLNMVHVAFASVIGGIIVLYGFGVPWWSISAQVPMLDVLKGSMVFIPGDLIKAGLATAIILVTKKSYPLITKVA
ncbi:biotin transporter BioY [Sneathiella limimaris]|uniref:biotin transporter BioY n=1 Tax=Sneathiella limimaris TaxID=1964213 RepID=UPI001469F622|nr:biotin transporter BioY [Sneathiella limimaris]